MDDGIKFWLFLASSCVWTCRKGQRGTFDYFHNKGSYDIAGADGVREKGLHRLHPLHLSHRLHPLHRLHAPPSCIEKTHFEDT